MSRQRKLLELKDKMELARMGGGAEAIEKQHQRGKLTARERLQLLLDPNSFEEIDAFRTHSCTDFGMADKKFLGDGVVTGYGTINGRLVFVYSFDFTVFGGSLSKVVAEKIVKIMEMATKVGAPLIGINDSGGARIQEGVDSLAGYTEIFVRNVLYSGVIPQISAIVGPCAGGAVYSPALTDFIFMVRKSAYMFLTGPKIVKTVTHEDVTADELGGADVHASKSGITHFTYDDEQSLFAGMRELLSYLPQNNMEEPPAIAPTDPVDRIDEDLNYIVPENPNKPYDMKEILAKVLDDGQFLEVQALYATNMLIGFGRLNGKVVGIVANQPRSLAGVIDTNASNKAARFVRTCDCFNIPIITFEDVPGFMPGTAQEFNGIIKHGAKLLYAFAEATVPKITVITRKGYGGAFCVMNSRQLRGDYSFAWPSAEIAVMGPEAAAEIIFAHEIKTAENPEQHFNEKVEEYREKFANPYIAASKGYIDEVIEPKVTRYKLIKTLEMLSNKRDTLPPKKHGNIPL
ncbi:MAG TPA: acyl-CoA carboxylase subunit beta [Candidatus Marinimicrobia bacterium]|jgi:propionyl-CoA carboxylase beta chain|nr:acyl-CoA carboxylase subunit beta [Candidatus Neomarinimicrobiota bacterium]HPN74947.1 acyl-CoA carboxylase subunit beta [Candidatus Neomarinimicrobiota bacterium]HPY01177.1 acyl-CoA carboxylase subunit beta [Candidatus Neomarinimicrobiota bacterium]